MEIVLTLGKDMIQVVHMIYKADNPTERERGRAPLYDKKASKRDLVSSSEIFFVG